MSTNLLLEVGSGVSVPFTIEGARGHGVGKDVARREALALAVPVPLEHEAAKPADDPNDEHVRKPDELSKE